MGLVDQRLLLADHVGHREDTEVPWIAATLSSRREERSTRVPLQQAVVF